MTQTRQTLAKLSSFFPEDSFEFRTFKTKGDSLGTSWVENSSFNHSSNNLIGDGIFVKELQLALLSKEADFAIHSLKDVPSIEPKGLMIASILKRESPNDVFLSFEKQRLEDMDHKCVGTGSPRRSMQLKLQYPKLKIKPIRGNIDTRLDKLSQGKYNGIVLAEAGLTRMTAFNRLGKISGLKTYTTLPKEKMTPAPGQGAIAIESRKDDDDLIKKLKSVHHETTWLSVSAERKVMKILEAGCKWPFGAYGEIMDGNFSLTIFLGNEKTGEWFRKTKVFSLDDDDKDFTTSLLKSVENWAFHLKKEAKQKNILL